MHVLPSFPRKRESILILPAGNPSSVRSDRRPRHDVRAWSARNRSAVADSGQRDAFAAMNVRPFER
jgi:hypothetical protein